MANEKNKKPLTMEELRAKVDKIAATVLPALHLNLQRIVDEQQPMSMDVLSVFHPDLQRVDKQLVSSMPTPQPVDMLELLPPPPLILLEQDLIYKTEAMLLGPLPPPPPAVAAVLTAPPLEQPLSVSSPPATRINMFTHTVEAGDEAEVDDEAVDLDRRMSVLISPVIDHLLEGDPSLHESGWFRSSRSLACCPRHRNLGPRFAVAPARCVWRRHCHSQPLRRIRGCDASCRGTSSSALGSALGVEPATSSSPYRPTLFAWDLG
jgi:hypothetical protein